MVYPLNSVEKKGNVYKKKKSNQNVKKMRPALRYLILLLVSCQNPTLSTETANTKLLEQLKAYDKQSNAMMLLQQTDSILQLPEQKDSVFLMKAKYYHAKAYFHQKRNETAIPLFKELTSFFAAHKLDEYTIKTNLYLSMSYSNLNEFTAANLHGIQAKKAAFTFKDTDLIAASLESLSFLSYKNKDFEKALEYMHESEDLIRIKGDTIKLATVMNNLGILYRRMGNYERANYYEGEAYSLSESSKKDPVGLAKSHTNMGVTAADKGNLKEAETHYLEAIRINETHQFQNPVPLKNLAGVYTALKRYDLSKEFYQRAEELLLQTNDKKELSEVYNALLDIAVIQGEIDAIRQYAFDLARLSTDIVTHEESERISMLKNQEELLDENFSLENKHQSARITLFSLVTVSALLLMLLIYIIQRFRTMRLYNERNAISLELKVLRSQMNPHFIFNTLTAIQNQVLTKDTVASAHSISRFAKLIRQNFDFTAKNEISLAEDLDALENYLQTQQERYSHRFEYTIEVDEKIHKSELLIPPLLLQPFVENAIEHGFKNIDYQGLITVKVSLISPDIIQFSIQDNGMGYFPKKDDALHAIDIIKKRLRLNDAGDENTLNIRSLGKNKGTLVVFNLYTKYN